MFMGKGIESGLFRPRSGIDPLSFILRKAGQLIGKPTDNIGGSSGENYRPRFPEYGY